jgi:hypothetical protein
MSDSDILQKTGENINANYNLLKSKNINNYENTNVTAIPDIINAINENLAELTLVQNNLSTENNINQEILVKKDQLLRMKNDDLMKQLKKLEIIQSNIANKDRIIEQTNHNINEQNTGINNLIISIFFAIILCILVFLYTSGIIDSKKFTISLIILIICFILLFSYAYNFLFLKNFISYLLNSRPLYKLEKKLSTWSSRVETAVTNEINETKQAWIKNHCSCPITEEETNEEEEEVTDIYAIDQNVVSKEIPGYFYYDGTAPAQLLVPTPDPILGLNEKIDWVDYSSNGNTLYNPNTDKVSYDNKFFYNYKNTTDPIIALKKRINNFNDTAESKSLVNNKTYSTNF